jgi:hypothetical protein
MNWGESTAIEGFKLGSFKRTWNNTGPVQNSWCLVGLKTMHKLVI